MVYGYYIKDTGGNERFFTEGCSYCSMSTGGRHQSICPVRGVIVSDRPSKIIHIREIRDKSHRELGAAWQYLADN